MASEKVLLKIPHQRIVCCHSAGSMTFGPGGLLHISTGDDTEHSQSQGYNPIDDDVLRNNPGDNPDADRAYDARRTSGNTNDLRGKILRIKPEADGTYTIPAGQPLPAVRVRPAKTKPEIYTMGHRNPFRIQVDQETGWVYNGEVGPDAGNENANRGPRGYDELNQIRQAGNMGWPYCIADNKAYRDWTFPSGPAGETFDCAGGPNNTSNYNTGLAKTPPADRRAAVVAVRAVPGRVPVGDRADRDPDRQRPHGDRRPDLPLQRGHRDSDTKLPAYYDDQVFFADWSRDWIATMTLDAERQARGDPRVPAQRRLPAPAGHRDGPGRHASTCSSGAATSTTPARASTPTPACTGSTTSRARARRWPRRSSDKDSGGTPLTVKFSSAGSEDPDGDTLTYEWDFGDGTAKSTAANPTAHVHDERHFTVQLTVTDTSGKSGSSSVVVTVGNTRPTVTLDIPQGGVYGWGDEIAYKVTVTDPEDGNIDCSKVVVSPGIFHDEGGNAHVHPGVNKHGLRGHDPGRAGVRAREEREHRARPDRDLPRQRRARLPAARGRRRRGA